MNIVIDEAAEVYVKDAKPRRELGEIPYLVSVDISSLPLQKVVYY